MTGEPPAIYNHVAYNKVVQHRAAKGKITAENWQAALLSLQETEEALLAMRDVWEWEQAGCPLPLQERKSEKIVLDSLVCPVCGVSFVPTNTRQVYCAESCRDARNRRTKAAEFATCANPECGVGFERINSKHRYCCERCNSRALYLARREGKGAL